MLRRFSLIIVAFLLTATPVAARSRAPEEGPSGSVLPGDVAAWQSYTVQLGEAFDCLAQRSGVSLDVAAGANGLVNPGGLHAGQRVVLPPPAAALTHVAAKTDTTRLSLAIAHNLSLWDVHRLNPDPLYAGKDVFLPGDGPATCLPYPLAALDVSPQPVDRGRTAIVVLETEEPAACEVTYLDQTEPCYPLDDSYLYALIGLSALMDPGTYDVKVALQADGFETAFTIPLDVAPGRYGFQYIDPPAQLSGLMDAALMQGEIDYLAMWRTIRTPERAWDFPLAFPLAVNVSVSADYGDRRSYGGMVNGYHSGVDYRAWTGVKVLAPADGVVVLAERLEARGNAILIDHGGGLVTGYWHLSRIDVEVGQHVERGEVVALVGNTGLSTGSHLHWEMWVNGVSVDGKQWLQADGFGGVHLPTVTIQDQSESVTNEGY